MGLPPRADMASMLAVAVPWLMCAAAYLCNRLFAAAWEAGRRPSPPARPSRLPCSALPRPAARGGRGGRSSTPCARPSTPRFVSLRAAARMARPLGATTFRGTQNVIITRSIVAGPCDSFRHSGYAESGSMSSLYERCTRLFHAGSSGTVSLSHMVGCAVVAGVRSMMGPVEYRLERLRSPAESGISLVIGPKGAKGHGKLLDEFMDKGLPWCRYFRLHLLDEIEGHTKLYSLFWRNEESPPMAGRNSLLFDHTVKQSQTRANRDSIRRRHTTDFRRDTLWGHHFRIQTTDYSNDSDYLDNVYQLKDFSWHTFVGTPPCPQ
ncbi:hypothetical protein EDB89DRAFT_1964496 [Lactarius sanguifluus]|nr:hypothetical protein EDB89DRAFT_1964496 [Lactarius sanguifluus]